MTSVGDAVTVVALPLLALTVQHASSAAIALLPGFAYLPTLLFGLPVDADAVSAAALSAVPVAAALGVLTTVQPHAVALLLGDGSRGLPGGGLRAPAPCVRSRPAGAGQRCLQTSEDAAMVGGPGLPGVLVQAVPAVATLVVAR